MKLRFLFRVMLATWLPGIGAGSKEEDEAVASSMPGDEKSGATSLGPNDEAGPGSDRISISAANTGNESDGRERDDWVVTGARGVGTSTGSMTVVNSSRPSGKLGG